MCPTFAPRPSAAFPPVAFDFEAWETQITRLAHHVDPYSRAIGTPRSDAVSFAADVGPDGVTLPDGVCNYGAYGNASWTAFETIIAGIEGGGAALGTATGRAANALTLKLLPAGSHLIVAGEDLYPGTRLLFEDLAEETGLEVTYAASNPAALEAALRDNTRMVFCEPLTNPHLDVTDLQAVVDFARRHKLISVADNTLTPLICRPLIQGFDIVTASATKYISGQNNTFGGYVAIHPRKTRLGESLRTKRNRSGAVMAPDVAARLAEQVKGLPSRFATHCRNADALADFLAEQPEVLQVYYPGHRDAASDRLAERQFSGRAGGVLAFELAFDFDIPAFLNGFKAGKLVETGDSLGADITLMNWYPEQSNWVKAMPQTEREARRFQRGFVRVAAGRGAAAPLLEEFSRSFAAARQSAESRTPEASVRVAGRREPMAATA